MLTGFRLVRHAAGGLLDEEDPLLLKRVLDALQKYVGGGVIRVHHLRAIRSGRFQHVEAHLVVPEFWSVERAHDLSEDVAARVIRDLGAEGEMVFHTDPCHRVYCVTCDLEDCPIRREPFLKLTPLTLEEVVQPDMPRSGAPA
jgi:divalent metal cation (Fe/Co/Zn/Cd) transporter